MHKHPLFLLITPDVNNVQHTFIVPSATSLTEARVLICTTVLRIPACCGVKKEDEIPALKRLHSVILANTGAKDLIELADGLYEGWYNRVQKANLSADQSPPMSENGGAPEVEQS